MDMQHFPPELIDEILKNRPVYIAIKHEHSYKQSNVKILGVFFNEHHCQWVIANDSLYGMDFNHYDPKKRFFQVQDTTWYAPIPGAYVWRDNWTSYRGVDKYHYEVWKPEQGQEEASARGFDFDSWFKAKICKENIPSADVKAMLCTWRDHCKQYIHKVPCELMGLFRPEAECHQKIGYTKSDREQWVAFYGTLPPYPFGDSCTKEKLDDV